MPTESDEDKEHLRMLITENDQLISEIEKLKKERDALIAFHNARSGDLGQSEEQISILKRVAEELRRRNQLLRFELGLKSDAPVPKPPDRSDK